MTKPLHKLFFVVIFVSMTMEMTSTHLKSSYTPISVKSVKNMIDTLWYCMLKLERNNSSYGR